MNKKDDDLCAACRHPNGGHDSDAYSLDGEPISCLCGCPDFVEYENDPEGGWRIADPRAEANRA